MTTFALTTLTSLLNMHLLSINLCHVVPNVSHKHGNGASTIAGGAIAGGTLIIESTVSSSSEEEEEDPSKEL